MGSNIQQYIIGINKNKTGGLEEEKIRILNMSLQEGSWLPRAVAAEAKELPDYQNKVEWTTATGLNPARQALMDSGSFDAMVISVDFSQGMDPDLVWKFLREAEGLRRLTLGEPQKPTPVALLAYGASRPVMAEIQKRQGSGQLTCIYLSQNLTVPMGGTEANRMLKALYEAATSAGVEERTLSARMGRLSEMIQHFRRIDPSEPWSGNPYLLQSLDEMEGFVRWFRGRFGDNDLENYLQHMASHDFAAMIRTSTELPSHSAAAVLAYGELLDNLRKAVCRVSGFPESRMIFLSPDDHAGWLAVAGKDVVVPEENTETGDWRLTVHPPAGMYIRTDDGRGGRVSLIALLCEQRPLWEILYAAHHEVAHDAQMERPGKLEDAPRFLELYRAVREGGQRRRDMVLLRKFLENPEPVTPVQLWQLLQGTTWNLMVNASRQADIGPATIASLVNFFGAGEPRPIPDETKNLILQQQPPILDRLFPAKYIHETRFEQALRDSPEIGPAAVEALDLQDNPEPLRAALGPERYEALADFIYRWGSAFVDKIHDEQRSILNGLRFQIAREVILNPDSAHPYRPEYAERLMSQVLEEVQALGAEAIEQTANFFPQVADAAVQLAAEFIRTDMPVETFRSRLREIFRIPPSASVGLEEGMGRFAPLQELAQAVRDFRVEFEDAVKIDAGFYLEGEGALTFAPILALLESREVLAADRLAGFAGVVETLEDKDRLLAVVESDPEAQELIRKRIYVVEEQAGEERQARYEMARAFAETHLHGFITLVRVRTRESDLLAQLNRLLSFFGYRLPEDPTAQEAALTLLQAA